eukprot:14014952-Alexandrium_andersonii.AAC.1
MPVAADSVHAEALFRLEVPVAVRAVRSALVGLGGIEVPTAAVVSSTGDVPGPSDPGHGRKGLTDVALPLGRVGLDKPKPRTNGLGRMREAREVGRGRPEEG